MRDFRDLKILALCVLMFAGFGAACSSGSPNGGGASASGGTGGIGGSGGLGNSLAECKNSLDCAGRADSKTVCSTGVGVCVRCLKASDCGETDGGTQDCIDNSCVSFSSCVNSLDCPKGRVCDRTLSRCVECTGDADCPGEAGTQRCVSNTCRVACSSDNNCTPLGLLCNTSGGYCVSCVNNIDCPENRWCNLGTCALDVCVAGATRCDLTGLSTCNSSGSSWGTPVACGTGRICSTSQGSAACLTQSCTPSALFCATVAEQVLSCATDGLSSTLSVDCGATSQVCVSSACKPVVCKAAARYCEAGAVRTCSTKGDSSTLYTTCTTSQYCDATATTPTCKTRLCTANAAACNGTLATTCNADGSGYIAGGTDCSVSSLYCVAGACTTRVCAPSTYFCQNGAVRYCSSDGMSSTISTTCTTSQYCDSTATTPTCKTRLCTASTPACNGTIATTCNADGSGYVADGTDCSATSLYCSAGACKARVCTPSTYFCDTGAVRYCASDGMSSTAYTTCTSTQYCDSTGTTPACKARVCTATAAACNGDTLTTCNADGSGYTTGGTDCTTSSQLCFGGACAAQAVETVASNSSVSSSYTYYAKLNVYKVTLPRTLKVIEQYLGVPASAPLTWVVFESASQTGTYTSVLSSNTSMTSAISGYVSSGTLTTPVTLKANYYYAIGVYWGASAVSYYYSSYTLPLATSFGSVVSGISVYNTTAAPTSVTYSSGSTVYPQRLTMTP